MAASSCKNVQLAQFHKFKKIFLAIVLHLDAAVMQTTAYTFCERVCSDSISDDEAEEEEVELKFDVGPEQRPSSIRIQILQHPSADFGSFTWPAR
jgi:hypothetical protein